MSSSVNWKEEPASPPSCDEASLLDVATVYQTTPFDALHQYDDVKFDADLAACETKAEIASYILENLENLMDLDDLIKDEPFLLDDKILPTILAAEEASPLLPCKPEYPALQQHTTQYLLKEFETMYDAVDTLTPPQSPPRPSLTALLPLNPLPDKHQLIDLVEFNYLPQPDIARELAVVEELVRERVEDMQWSPRSSEGGSSSNFDDSSSEDPEWVPEPVDDISGGPTKKRSARSGKGKPEEKRVRKKEQNKNAATRYRMKKKAEVEVILHEEKKMLDARTELCDKITDLEREIKCLKGLMRDLFKAKGLIS